ncbi:hypothetical protein HLB44_15950 [Aquincola sp. S2]|uniref:Uncharacterized protein n=1 Tax=Pseudaquabacterium terrae TaxID=2732868 RepID=A0ABX2EIQ2_9BURK|nr:hypothetical protein [Aquabacterium terrae]NRF68488.1 hypothetical protein [Aquabacterium terrae]
MAGPASQREQASGLWRRGGLGNLRNLEKAIPQFKPVAVNAAAKSRALTEVIHNITTHGQRSGTEFTKLGFPAAYPARMALSQLELALSGRPIPGLADARHARLLTSTRLTAELSQAARPLSTTTHAATQQLAAAIQALRTAVGQRMDALGGGAAVDPILAQADARLRDLQDLSNGLTNRAQDIHRSAASARWEMLRVGPAGRPNAALTQKLETELASARGSLARMKLEARTAGNLAAAIATSGTLTGLVQMARAAGAPGAAAAQAALQAAHQAAQAAQQAAGAPLPRNGLRAPEVNALEDFIGTIPQLRSRIRAGKDDQFEAVEMARALVKELTPLLPPAVLNRLTTKAAELVHQVRDTPHRHTVLHEARQAADRLVHKLGPDTRQFPIVMIPILAVSTPFLAARVASVAIANSVKEDKTSNKAIKLLTELIAKIDRREVNDEAMNAAIRVLVEAPDERSLKLRTLCRVMVARARPNQCRTMDNQLLLANKPLLRAMVP